MYFENGFYYHIYNRGNNSQKIFFRENDYIIFLQKIRKELKPICEIIAYCLMPNHFHLMVKTSEMSIKPVNVKNPHLQILSRKIGTIQSSYSQKINIREKRTGSLFQQKTKAKLLHEITFGVTQKPEYAKVCFAYIHNNPKKAKLVETNEEWRYSSFLDYSGLRNGTLCNKKLALEDLGANLITTNDDFDDDILENIW